MRNAIKLSLVLASAVAGAVACGSSTTAGTGASATTSTSHATSTGSTSATSTSGSGTNATSTSGTSTSTSSSGAGGGGVAGPGAALKCASNGTKNAFDTYGAAAFVAVNESIFTLTGAEIADAGTSNLGSSFTEVGTGNVAATSDSAAVFKGKLAAFLVWVYGGPNSIKYTDGNTYVGNDQNMTTAHTGLAITTDQYNYFLTNIVVPALSSNGVPTGDITSCFAPPVEDPTFIATIVGH